MWDFYKRIGVVGNDNAYTAHFGDPLWVYFQYRLAKGDTRSMDEVYAEGRQTMGEIDAAASTWQPVMWNRVWDLNPPLAVKVKGLYDDAKAAPLGRTHARSSSAAVPGVVPVRTLSKDRNDYIAHPDTGEMC